MRAGEWVPAGQPVLALLPPQQRKARFYVIKHVTCPAALVECGFLTNRAEADKIAQDGYRDGLAEGIARGILTFLSRVREAHWPPVRADS